jgi:hypothetical protein
LGILWLTVTEAEKQYTLGQANNLGNLDNLDNLSTLGNLDNLNNLSTLGNLDNLGNLSTLGNVDNLGNRSSLGNLGNLHTLGNLVRMRRGRFRILIRLDHPNRHQLRADELFQIHSQLFLVQWVCSHQQGIPSLGLPIIGMSPVSSIPTKAV